MDLRIYAVGEMKKHTCTVEELIGSLNDIEKKHAPKQLHVSGNTDFVEQHPRVSVIGTRKPSLEGVSIAQKITQFLVDRKIIIVSGLAEGIDTIAHKTAIHFDGKTIAVLGTPLDTHYPAKNKELQEQIAQEHLLVSEFEEGTPIQRKNFPQRNRTMALISNASIIIEAGKTSGTQHQGWEALRLGRPLFIMESLVNDESLRWPQKLVEYGAQPINLDTLENILEVLPESNLVIENVFSS